MKISVITIVRNDKNNIRKTIESVIHQTKRDVIEYIIVDGASTDGTSDIIGTYKDKIDLHICEPDSGIYNAMNKGIRSATGDYIIFLNSGDVFTENSVIENILPLIPNETLPAIIYGNYRQIVEGKPTCIIPCRNKSMIWYGPVASHQSTLYNLHFIREHGLNYDESYKVAADYKLTLQVLTLSKNVLKTNICISDFDMTGLSNSNKSLGLSEANRARKEILGWSNFRCFLLKIFLIFARLTRQYLSPIYYFFRKRI